MKAYEIKLKKIKRVNPITGDPVWERNDKNKPIEGKQAYYNYREQLWLILTNVSDKQGLSTEDMMKRASLQFMLESAKDEEFLHLSEDQFESLKKVFDMAKWVAVNPLTAQMIKEIKEAEAKEVNIKDDKKK